MGWTSSAILQDTSSVESLFNVVGTETIASFEHLSFESLKEFDVFAPAERERIRHHEPPEMMRGFLHLLQGHLRNLRPVMRELQNAVV